MECSVGILCVSLVVISVVNIVVLFGLRWV